MVVGGGDAGADGQAVLYGSDGRTIGNVPRYAADTVFTAYGGGTGATADSICSSPG